MGASGKSVVVEGGKRGVLLDSKSAAYDAEESCPACCVQFSQIWSFADQGFIYGEQLATSSKPRASRSNGNLRSMLTPWFILVR